jgi:hypothetical protein
MAEQKDTIYIDIDDEITSIIDKVRGSKNKILALVLPKRATTLQSIVNMKLLKRTADDAKKHIVLITSETNLLPLAGAVGLHVAKTLQTKPAIPPPPDVSKSVDSIEDTDVNDEEPMLDESKSIGELAGLPDETPAHVAAAEETIDIDNSDDDTEGGKAVDAKKAHKKIKVPNFNTFRLRLVLGIVGLIGLIVLWFVMFRVLPKASVTIQTDNQTVNDSPSITVNTAAKTVDLTSNTLPAEIQDDKITVTQKAASTGKKNIGNKSSGAVSLQNCTHTGGSVQIPAGTGVSTNGLTFITQDNVTLPASIFNGLNQCITNTKDVDITAQSPGTQYNVAASSTFAVAGYPSVSGSNSNALSGGTDQIVTVLNQSDIDGAKQKIVSNTTQAQNDLSKALKTAGDLPISATLVTDDSSVSSSANAGDQVSEVTVTVVTTYHMLGVKKTDLETVIANDLKGQINSKKQVISDYGLGGATFSQTAKKSTTEQTLTLKTTVITGAQIDTASLKLQIEGKKSGDVAQMIESQPSVKKAIVNYSPFWVSTAPRKTSRINIVVQNVQSSNGK